MSNLIDRSGAAARGRGPGDPLCFGPFRLFETERRLEKDGLQLDIGSRAFEVLIALVARAGEVIGKRELLEIAWQGLTVEEGSLRFHISALRKLLGDDGASSRYIVTVSGHGYCFVAPVAAGASAAPDARPPGTDGAARLPARLARMVGRDEDLGEISARLLDRRFVSIVGSGGIGKTTTAVSVGHALGDEFDGAVHFVDFGLVDDPARAAAAIASAFGLAVAAEDPSAALLARLRDRRALLVLDCCEHVIETVAACAQRIFQAAPGIHILATSREALRVEGEQVHRLRPLACPPARVNLTAADALAFPAVQLFVERMTSGGFGQGLHDRDAAVVAGICRRLDGIALALELAAGRVGAFGIRGTADLLDTQFRLLWHGQRTAVSRHQTLNATLDWSYTLLPEIERVILRRLSVFVGWFPLDAAEFVATGDQVTRDEVLAGIESLIAKSLVIANTSTHLVRYRLLNITCAYALRKLCESGEAKDVARRHARHACRLPRRFEAGTPDAPPAALAWCPATPGDPDIADDPAGAAGRVLLEMPLWHPSEVPAARP